MEWLSGFIHLTYIWNLVRGQVPQRDSMERHKFVEKQPLLYSLAALIAELEVLLPPGDDEGDEDDGDDDDKWGICKIFFIAEAPPSTSLTPRPRLH